jgi:nucleotide-binding universal stress UspA family protein
MKFLVPVDGSRAALAPLPHLIQLSAAGVPVEALLLNVQPRFHRHIAQFTRLAQRNALREERSRSAMAAAIAELSRSRLLFHAVSEVGAPAERIAEVAQREHVAEILIGVGRHPAWLRWINPSIAQGVMERTDIPVTVFARGQASAFSRYAVPAGVAGLAALFMAGE